jgi:hypothetical protein
MSVQTMTVEYEVPGLVDGVSPAPPFSYDPKSDLYKKPDAEGIVRFSAAEMIAFNGGNLGLFDPDFGVGGTFADRFLHLVEVRTAGGGVAAAISVVDARDPALPGQEDILAPSPEANFYSDDCIFVPQGSGLAFAGFNPTPSQPVVIRISVVAWGSIEDYALLLRQCCCEELGDTPPSEDCCPPQVLDARLAIGQSTTELLTLPGCNLTDGMTAEVRKNPLAPPSVGTPTVNSVTVATGTPPEADTVTISLDTTGTEGEYMLILTNECGCCTVTPFQVQVA